MERKGEGRFLSLQFKLFLNKKKKKEINKTVRNGSKFQC
jgi:hypothetical protein